MKITALETVRVGEHPNILFVEIVTDEGIVGLGETFFGAEAVAVRVHESIAPVLIGQDPLRRELWSRRLVGYLGGDGPGVEMRACSAIDIALWDILGQATGQPLYVLLGGRSRDDIRIYNTCAGPRYMRGAEQRVANWGLNGGEHDRYDDLNGFLHRADVLAEELLADGISAMKIWPFDIAAEAHGGVYITRAELDQALEPLRKVRAAVGAEMEVMLEFHSLWNLPTAKQIAHAVEDLDPFWLEDPISLSSVDAIAALKASTPFRIAGGEVVATRRRFQELLERGALDVVIVDVSWAGGLTEAKKIADLADTHRVPVAPHDCTGPVVLTASTHLAIAIQNAIFQETVRASYRGWYNDLVTDLPPIRAGAISPTESPGLGTSLQPGVREREDAVVTSTRLENGELVRRQTAGAGARV